MSQSPLLMTSASLDALAPALAQAQAVMHGAAKDGTNPHFRSGYPTLTSMREAAVGPLTAHGLSVIQGVTAEGAQVAITTRLLHASGQFVESTLTMVAKDAGPQSIGSCITYGRRYALAAMVGIAPEDDDAEQAEGRSVGYSVTAPAATRPAIPPGDEGRETVAAPTPGETGALRDLPHGAHYLVKLERNRDGAKSKAKAWVTDHLQHEYALYDEGLVALCEQIVQDGDVVTLEIKHPSTGGKPYIKAVRRLNLTTGEEQDDQLEPLHQVDDIPF